MPHKPRRQSHSLNAAKQRWSNETCASSDDSSFSMDVGDEIEADENYDFRGMIHIHDIADIFELFKDQCNIRYLSVLIYLTLSHLNISYQETCTFLKHIGSLLGQIAHKWSNSFLHGRFDEFAGDARGGKRGDSFYDVYPELEVEACAFSVLQCQQKTASFTAYDLAQFIDKRYHEIANTNKIDSNPARSVESCRLDLRKWGARFEKNTKRSYFEGHDRPDVVSHRHQFIHHFLTNEDKYYCVSSDENPVWINPKTVPGTILICKSKVL